MCGICGYYLFDNSSPDEHLVKKMCSVIQHRGPDDEGIFLDRGIGMGMRRLSIIDIEGGHQPVHNEDGSIWIVLNGEIYNYKELRLSLEKNHRFYTSSDTEVIVHLYEEFGEEFISKLNGMFGLAIWDSNKKLLLLARDRIGIKPLHYIVNKNKLIFGSEIKSILQHPDIKREVNLAAFHYFLSFEYIPAPESIFKGIMKLMPGHILLCKDNNISIRKYWDIEFSGSSFTEEHFCDQICNALKRSVNFEMVSDVPLGAFLSGGIDSSAVVAAMNQLSDQPVKTFSIGFEDQSYNELEYARIVAERFNTDHHEEIIKPDAVKLADSIIRYFDEPFADVSAFSTYLVSEIASRYVTVVLSGDGGDELFAGYDWYIASYMDRYYRRLPSILRNRVILPAVQVLPYSSQKKGLINIAKRFVEGSSLPEKGRHVRWQFFLPDRKALYSRRLQSEVENLNSFEIISKVYSKNNTKDPLSREQYVDIKMYLPDDILVKVDRMSMANSIEARVPLLNHIFVELTATIPAYLKLNGLSTKYIFKKAMSKLLPGEIIYRKKQGFSIPMKNWLREDLRDMMIETLSRRRIEEKGYVEYEYVNKLMRQHLEKKRNNAHQLWALMVFEMWHDMYMDTEVGNDYE
ncbi:asparagine synthase, glutamine-hydrolyzing [Candidatus Methanoperedens nitroreducens]|uniref:Putative asparagine synthetase [glutamine-hydrolyzing] n=1 Tax=Candidatus Methanoperedens nitratireducens TaxID=1392998 RepID=A0A062UZE5_9EURY|nr:asparagine synthase (glutamine-hydrolyzing) [Candidatus Methanoperedens nitroreducens]KCZ72301.1 asparagine synthase, glutamine-hydrolyzing [Candidatus Methanoperedens nitroreducens]MDJ1420765.1 asparagine synthase (glutamine-hydrolyzing) [Candidatus Methanoperedens sp.]